MEPMVVLRERSERQRERLGVRKTRFGFGLSAPRVSKAERVECKLVKTLSGLIEQLECKGCGRETPQQPSRRVFLESSRTSMFALSSPRPSAPTPNGTTTQLRSSTDIHSNPATTDPRSPSSPCSRRRAQVSASRQVRVSSVLLAQA